MVKVGGGSGWGLGPMGTSLLSSLENSAILCPIRLVRL
jgi:hypothetical protein